MNKAIVRDVNCLGFYADSPARQFCRDFPDNEKAFLVEFGEGRVEPGRLFTFDRGRELSPRFVFNLPTRIHWKGEVNITWLKQGIQAVFDACIKHHVDSLTINQFADSNIEWEETKLEFLTSFSRVPDIRMDFVDGNPKPKEVTIFTDGGANHEGRGGYGVVLRFGEKQRELSGGLRSTTSQRMELLAAIVGLESLKEPCLVRLHSDSRYVVDSVTTGALLRWRASDWKKGKLVNKDLWKRFLKAYLKHRVTMVWVKGHAGVADNERCDRLASAAIQGAEE